MKFEDVIRIYHKHGGLISLDRIKNAIDTFENLNMGFTEEEVEQLVDLSVDMAVIGMKTNADPFEVIKRLL